MIDIKDIRTRYSEIRKNIQDRYMDVDLDRIVSDMDRRSELLKRTEALRARRNETASKMKGKLDADTRNQLIAEGKAIKEELAQAEAELSEVEAAFRDEVRTIPNYASPDAPVGKEDKDSLAIRFYGKPTEFAFRPKDHVQLGEELDIIDFEKGAKVAGQKFYFITPDIAKEEILQGIGFNPRGAESNIYTIQDTGTCLVGTAEITLGGYYSDEILDKKDLPIKMTGLSHCFRREAGGAGQYSKGLYRVHQFSKLEMFIYCLPEESESWHQHLLSIEEEIFQGLGLPYRVVDTATGDLGAPAYRKFDIEAWMPGRGESGEYGEVTSTSNCTDYQARSLNIRYRDDDGKLKFVHMLNGTAVALSRAIVAILENYQMEDGSVAIPPALVSYCGFDRITKD